MNIKIQDAGVWTKASEELSIDMEPVCIRYISTFREFYYRKAFYNESKKRYENDNTATWHINEVEWLKPIKGYVLTEDEPEDVLEKFQDFLMNEMYDSNSELNLYKQFIKTICQ